MIIRGNSDHTLPKSRLWQPGVRLGDLNIVSMESDSSLLFDCVLVDLRWLFPGKQYHQNARVGQFRALLHGSLLVLQSTLYLRNHDSIVTSSTVLQN